MSPGDLPGALAPLVRRLWRARPEPQPPASDLTAPDHTDQSVALVRDCEAFTRDRQTVLCQQSGTTCGPNTLAMFRVLTDPDYAADAVLVREQGAWGQVERLLQQVMNSGGRGVLPWPTAWGTLPWALAAQLTQLGRGAGPVPDRWAVARVDPRDAAAVRAVLQAAGRWCRLGVPVPLYLGNDRLPRHVVLLLAVSGEPARVNLYDPAVGGLRQVALADLASGAAAVAGWRRVWAAVLPR